MRIEDATQTVGGHPVRIYAVLDNCVHGAVWFMGQWVITVWGLNGGVKPIHCPKEFNLDLHDWRDEIPWEHLRDEIQWVARSGSVKWWGFDSKPVKIEAGVQRGWFKKGLIYDLTPVKMPEGPDKWTDAIAKRPNTESKK